MIEGLHHCSSGRPVGDFGHDLSSKRVADRSIRVPLVLSASFTSPVPTLPWMRLALSQVRQCDDPRGGSEAILK